MGCCKDDEKYEGADYADPNYEGQEINDPNLKSGPAENRGCTDILCCILFIAFLGAMGYIAMLGMANGKPTQLLDIYDPEGSLTTPHFS